MGRSGKRIRGGWGKSEKVEYNAFCRKRVNFDGEKKLMMGVGVRRAGCHNIGIRAG